jgi:hypothetical protein
MMFPLPCGEFVWVDPEEAIKALETYDVNTSPIGYYMEVDIEVPKEIHDLVSAYPLFPEVMDGKLKATLYDKKNSRVHIAYLQLGIGLCYKITKVHRAIRFKQERVMNNYVLMLAEERKKYPKGTFLNDLYKLMANSLFGNTIENPENYPNHKVAIGDDDCIRLLNNERLRNFHKLDKNCETILAELELEKVDYSKPIAIGCTILDLSKTYMQYFYYCVLRVYYGDRMRFMYTDTDSIVCWLKTNDVKQDIKNMQDWFESEQTKGMPGVMKVEKDNIVEFRAFCPKHYYYIQKIGDKYKVSEAFKGIPSHVRSSKDLTQEEIIEHLQKGQSLPSISSFEMKSIRSKNHEVIIQNVKKTITDKDDKREYIDEYHTVALGYIA